MSKDKKEEGCSFYYKLLFFYIAFILRLFFIYVAKIVDESGTSKKYTDTDYDVFTDAAGHIPGGGSPYARKTYRYSPIAAYMCLPNIFIHYCAGKVIFSIFDIIMGIFMWKIIESQNRSKRWTWVYVAFWLFNPVVIMMSSRGSNDNIIICFVFATLYFLLKEQYFVAGLWYGLSVHFKLYPIIYSFVFYLYIDFDR